MRSPYQYYFTEKKLRNLFPREMCIIRKYVHMCEKYNYNKLFIVICFHVEECGLVEKYHNYV